MNRPPHNHGHDGNADPGLAGGAAGAGQNPANAQGLSGVINQLLQQAFLAMGENIPGATGRNQTTQTRGGAPQPTQTRRPLPTPPTDAPNAPPTPNVTLPDMNQPGTAEAIQEAFMDFLQGTRDDVGEAQEPPPPEPTTAPAGTPQGPQPQQQQQQRQRRTFDGFGAFMNFVDGALPPLPPNAFNMNIPRRHRNAPSGPKPDWTLPPPPGLTLRQRVEKREREMGLRCFDMSCWD
ncbi:hypothetical protein NLI96_g13320 [Meripilus lineatus]|uniref:Uncharacterized protein n=1 Tax=Meripilus lineatus TaxID=2056292 RepID=A0AAD5Y7F1_9APHY|nr:hypothetical protein NLI96_g13320 [Physisporinus lineatus]